VSLQKSAGEPLICGLIHYFDTVLDIGGGYQGLLVHNWLPCGDCWSCCSVSRIGGRAWALNLLLGAGLGLAWAQFYSLQGDWVLRSIFQLLNLGHLFEFVEVSRLPASSTRFISVWKNSLAQRNVVVVVVVLWKIENLPVVHFCFQARQLLIVLRNYSKACFSTLD